MNPDILRMKAKLEGGSVEIVLQEECIDNKDIHQILESMGPFISKLKDGSLRGIELNLFVLKKATPNLTSDSCSSQTTSLTSQATLDIPTGQESRDLRSPWGELIQRHGTTTNNARPY